MHSNKNKHFKNQNISFANLKSVIRVSYPLKVANINWIKDERKKKHFRENVTWAKKNCEAFLLQKCHFQLNCGNNTFKMFEANKSSSETRVLSYKTHLFFV